MKFECSFSFAIVLNTTLFLNAAECEVRPVPSAAAITAISGLQPGSTREEVNKRLEQDGGIYGEEERWVAGPCDNQTEVKEVAKVKIVFTAPNGSTVRSMSKPYCEPRYID